MKSSPAHRDTVPADAPHSRERIAKEFIERTRSLLLADRTIRRSLPLAGRLHIDRQLPFLFVYRSPIEGDDPGTDRLVVGEAAYLALPPGQPAPAGVRALITTIAETGVEIFGGFLVVEVWSGPDAPERKSKPLSFVLHHRGTETLAPTLATLAEELERIRLQRRKASVQQVVANKIAPPGRSPLLSRTVEGVYTIGVEAPPVYRAGPEGPVYPLVLRSLHRKLSTAFRKSTFRFARTLTTHRPKHFHALGRRVFVKSVWDVDRKLADVGGAFDFLLAVSPTNSRRAWAEFRRSGYERTPRFSYPQLGIAPTMLKRRLFAIPIERIEDPEIAYLFRQKQDEVDRQLTGLSDRSTSRFVCESVQLFGGVEPELLDLAETVLDLTVGRSEESSGIRRVHADEFAVRARQEIEFFRSAYAQTAAEVQIRDDVNGLMVSRGNLLIPRDLSVPASRVEALIQHEVGTHVLTYTNGRAQPFRQLYLGLAGYDPLQEGIAILGEHLAGGLTAARLRLLAARVVAVRNMLDGATFIDVFRALVRKHGFSTRSAFTIVMRVFRGGGLTKDAAYLRGIASLLAYMRTGGEIEPLLVGKIASDHLPLVQELLRRKALRPPPLRPRYLQSADSLRRLDLVRRGVTVVDLIPRRRSR